MASSTKHVVLFLTILLGILSISATARPCKALFISTFSYSFKPQNPNPNPNPNPNNLLFLNPNPSGSGSGSGSGSLTIFTTRFTQFNNPNTEIEIFLDRRLRFNDDELQIQRQQQQQQQQRAVIPFGFSSSLRDRTKDILSVVVALLFGVGCGALAAATMYLVWTLFASRYDYSHFDHDVDDEKEDADVSPKKMGYVKIPPADK